MGFNMTTEDVELDLTIPEGAMGSKLRELLIKFQGFHGRINEMRDEAQFEKEMIETAIEATTDKALFLVSDIYKGQKRNMDLQKAEAKLLPVPQGAWSLDSDEKSVMDLKKDLALAKFKVRRATSRLQELEKAIDICRSGLAWDRQELGRTSE